MTQFLPPFSFKELGNITNISLVRRGKNSIFTRYGKFQVEHVQRPNTIWRFKNTFCDSGFFDTERTTTSQVFSFPLH